MEKRDIKEKKRIEDQRNLPTMKVFYFSFYESFVFY